MKRKATDYQPDPSNANTGTERGLRALDDSLSKYGAGRSILVDKNGYVIAGNKTLERAVDLGIDDVIEVETDGNQLVSVKRTDLDLLTDPKARELAYADNRVGQLDLTWDAERLLADLNSGVDLSQFWREDELQELLASIRPADVPTDPGAQIDKAAELQQKWQVARGDLWAIGKHRLLCGDSTNADDVARVMAGERAVLFSTDPPYGVDFEGQKYNPRAKDWDGIEGDTRQGDDLEQWFRGCLVVWLLHMTDDAAFYAWAAPMREGAKIADAIRSVGLHIQSQIVWVKNTLVLGQSDYQWKHEICWYAFWKGKHHRWYGERDKTSVWEIDKLANSAYMHPMQKPTELYSIPMQHHTQRGDLCAEPFAGSGSQFVAAEQFGRIVYGIEIEPKFCAVILDRLERMGLTPERV